jgi:Na+-driven multidrug efflux pump
VSLLGGIIIFAISYLAIGGVLVGYNAGEKRGLEIDEILIYLVGWPAVAVVWIVSIIIHFPAKFGEWLYKKTKDGRRE